MPMQWVAAQLRFSLFTIYREFLCSAHVWSNSQLTKLRTNNLTMVAANIFSGSRQLMQPWQRLDLLRGPVLQTEVLAVLAVSSNFSARLLLEDSAGPAPADPLVCGAHAYWAYLPCFVPILSYLFLLKVLYTYIIDLPQLESKLGPSYAGDSAPHTDRHDPIYGHLFEKPSPLLAQGI